MKVWKLFTLPDATRMQSPPVRVARAKRCDVDSGAPRQLATQGSILRSLAASCLTATSIVRLVLQGLRVDRLAMLRLQKIIGKAQNLKTVPIADDPKIQLGPFP